MAGKKVYRVGTFAHERGDGRKPLVTAYTQTYNPQWPGCLELDIEAESGDEAKKKAKEIARKLYEKCAAAFPLASADRKKDIV